ncbi:MAG: NAD(P)/FAD-dependent oxidoreductase [Candidatus Diapherotrites archaeon]|nr:NAD(P)/FAD-dependent oxidoreductase [Candidatus Diapherotrites archaeon]
MITVVGGGPAGLLCAKEIAHHGKKVRVFEEHKEIGKPVQCAGLVSKKGLDNLNVDYGDSVLNKVRGAFLYAPDGTSIEVKRNETQAYVIDRGLFDKIIAEEAKSEGAEIVLGRRWDKHFVFENELVVGADGPLSSVAKSVGVEHKCIYAYQIETRYEHELDRVSLFFGSFAPGFFAWIIPVDEKISRIGIGVNKGNPKDALMRFLKGRGIKAKQENESAGLIPVFDNKKTAFQNIALVGDAAAQVKATTGGGIAIGGFCGLILGNIIGRDLPLEMYERTWREEFERELVMHLKIRRAADTMSDTDYNELFHIGKEEGIEHIIEQYGDMDRPTKMIMEIMKRPGLMFKLSRYLKYLR